MSRRAWRTAATVEGQFSLLKYFIFDNPPLLGALRRQDAAGVGIHYNGAGYRRNRYDVKWAAAARASAMWPFSTRVKRSRISSVGSPIAMVRVTSVVPSSYCAPESTSSNSPG